MASAVLVSDLDATVNCGEMTSLFEDCGTVVQAVTLSPANGGAPGSAVIYFAEPRAGAEAVNMFDGHPWAGCFLEVRQADTAAAARVLAALAEVQGAPGPASKGPGPGPPPLATTGQSRSVTAPAAASALAFGSGPAVPIPTAFGAGGSVAPVSTPLPAGPSGSRLASMSEPPEFGGECYDPNDWTAPADWQQQAPAASGSAGGGWATAAAGAGAKAQPAAIVPPGMRTARTASASSLGAGPGKPAPASASEPAAPEWETDSRCRIFVQGLRLGCSADDMKAYFSRFGALVDTSVVPKQRIGFLTFARGDAGQAALDAVHNTSVPGLSPSGSEALRLEFRSIEKIKRHMEAKRADVSDQPTTRVFIGYFPRSTKRAAVAEELSRFGQIDEVMIGGGQDGGECFVFVQYRRVQDAARAKTAIHNHTLPSLAGARPLLAAFKEPRRF